MSESIIVQRNLDVSLRMVDSDYSCDLILENISTSEVLKAVMERAQTN